MQVEEKTINLAEVAGEINALQEDNGPKVIKVTLTNLTNGRTSSHNMDYQTMIGRALSNDIVVDNDRAVSGTHCRIIAGRDCCRIEDKNSANGTYINSKMIQGQAVIKDSDILCIGNHEYMVNLEVI